MAPPVDSQKHGRKGGSKKVNPKNIQTKFPHLFMADLTRGETGPTHGLFTAAFCPGFSPNTLLPDQHHYPDLGIMFASSDYASRLIPVHYALDCTFCVVTSQ